MRARTPHIHTRRSRGIGTAGLGLVLVTALSLSLAGCDLAPADGSGSAEAEGSAPTEVTLVVHDSFVDGDAFAAAASAATGYDVHVLTSGDGGELTNTLVLTKGAPIADAFFGVNDTFASRLIDNDVVVPIRPRALPDRAASIATAQFVAGGQASEGTTFPMIPVDLGAICINVDTDWFAAHEVAPPASYDDLLEPAYAGLTVVIDPTASTTGASFLTGTVAAFGDPGYLGYWERLMKNGVRIEPGWSEAYNGQFTQGGGDGTFPIVLSYSTSPAWTLSDDGTRSTTEALLNTCTTQVEYAGVLAGAANPAGAEAVVEYLLSPEFQASIPESMYMYPVDATVELPEDWQRFAALPDAPHDLTPAEVGAGRERWLKAWSETVGW